MTAWYYNAIVLVSWSRLVCGREVCLSRAKDNSPQKTLDMPIFASLFLRQSLMYCGDTIF